MHRLVFTMILAYDYTLQTQFKDDDDYNMKIHIKEQFRQFVLS